MTDTQYRVVMDLRNVKTGNVTRWQVVQELREDGAYERGDAVDVCSAVREEIAALEDYLQQYVN